jgi:hypothetical protein
MTLVTDKSMKEIVRAAKEDNSASQSLVKRGREGAQIALEGSNTGRKDRQNDEANRRCSQTESRNHRHWPRPRSVALRAVGTRGLLGSIFGRGLAKGVCAQGLYHSLGRENRFAIFRRLILFIDLSKHLVPARVQGMSRPRSFVRFLTTTSRHCIQAIGQLI